MRRILSALLTALALSPATSQQVRDCDTWVASARNLSRPLPEATRSYAEGAISVIELDTGGEPACCSYHVMVLYPDPEGPGELCALVQARDGMGYLATDLARATAAYDARRGLTVRIPASEFGEVHPTPLTLEVTVNRQTGAVTARHGAP